MFPLHAIVRFVQTTSSENTDNSKAETQNQMSLIKKYTIKHHYVIYI